MGRKQLIGSVAVVGVAAIALGVGIVASGDDHGGVDGPVIAVSDWNGYPTAEISGQLRLVEGCLLLDEAVVFWQEGASWDAANRAVVFEGADPVPVGSEYSGGGGAYPGGDVEGLDGVDVDAINECVDRTGAGEVVIATAPGD